MLKAKKKSLHIYFVANKKRKLILKFGKLSGAINKRRRQKFFNLAKSKEKSVVTHR